jgi:hypothetical protein
MSSTTETETVGQTLRDKLNHLVLQSTDRPVIVILLDRFPTEENKDVNMEVIKNVHPSFGALITLEANKLAKKEAFASILQAGNDEVANG